MEVRLPLEILAQPDDVTCGPTSLHALYRYYGDDLPLEQVIAEIQRLDHGGTLAVLLGIHALRRGYRATIYTYNLLIFDPTWFEPGAPTLSHKLREQLKHKTDPTFTVATEGYLEFLELGGRVRFEDLTPDLLFRYLAASTPVLTGLSATYLYRCAREFGPRNDYDDVRGVPSGHFVVLSGFDRTERTVLVADPLYPNPRYGSHKYVIDVDRVIRSIILGVLTYDAVLLVIEPNPPEQGSVHGDPDRRQ